MLHFQHIEYLLALLLVPVMIVLYAFLLRWKKNTAKKIGDAALVGQLTADYSPAKFRLKFILFAAAFTAAVIALANPRKPMGSATVNRSGIDVVIALDVSKSMLAQDIRPDRLERSRQVLSKLIDRLSSDRIGIVVFAGRAYLQMPLTTDHAAAKMYLSSAGPDVVPTQGTVISDALKMCYAAFNPNEKKYRAIVLVSDGEDHDQKAVSLAKSLASEGVMINTVGIGSPEGSMIMDPETNEVKIDAKGHPVVTKLNEDELRNIAVAGSGIYQLFTSTDEVVANLEAQLKTMGQKPITENSLVNFQNFFPWLLGLALLLLAAEFFIAERKRRHESNTRKMAAATIRSFGLLCLLPAAAFAQKDLGLVKKGNEAYNKQDYKLARENYKKAATLNPDNEAAQYNLGNASFRTENGEAAVEAYNEAIRHSSDPGNKAQAYYNKGVVLQNNKKLPECIDAYKHALRLNPRDEDARLNLQKALQQQQQQQQQQKDKKDKEPKKPKNDPKKKDQQKQSENEKNDLPKPQPSKMTRKEAEEKLNALLQQEKKLQDKLRKVNAASPEKPEKDW